MSRSAKKTVLFLCTGNSARSQIAEALLQHHGGNRFISYSAGLKPKEKVHPMALKVLSERGFDVSGLHPKPLSRFFGTSKIDYAIIVCEGVEEACPHIYPLSVKTLHWPFDDPTVTEGSEEEILATFRQLRDELEKRIKNWLQEQLT